MLKSVVRNVRISGLSTVLPKQEIDIFSYKNLYEGNQKKITRVVKSSGFHKFRVIDKGTTAADLCQRAAEDLLENMKVDRQEIDAIILVTQYPDYVMPGTACVLHGKMGLKKACAAFDVNQGCAGYTYGLWIAGRLVSEDIKTVLLLVGDTPNSLKGNPDNVKDTAPMFGDGGTATLLKYDETAKPIYFDIGTDGTGVDALVTKNGAFRNPPKLEDFTAAGEYNWGAGMDALAVVDFTLREVPPSIESVLSYADWKKEDIDYFLLHQANKIIIENIGATLQVPSEKLPVEPLSKFGNLSCASIPSIIADELSEKLQNGTLNLVMSGFGIGLSWVSVALELGNMYCSKIIDYEGNVK